MAACGICLELFDSVEFVPRILQCGHSICENCLKFLHIYTEAGDLSPNSPLCPTCRDPITCLKLAQLPKNFSLIENSVKKKTLYCPQHEDLGLQAILFCLKCNVYVCHKCIATSHNGHEFEDLEKRVDKVKKSVIGLKTAAEEQREKQNKLFETYVRKKESILVSQEEAKAGVRDFFGARIKKLEEECGIYTKEIEDLYKRDIEELDATIELARQRKKLVEKVIGKWHDFEGRLDSMSEKEILQLDEGNSELNDLKVNTANINFQFIPEQRLHKYRFTPRTLEVDVTELGNVTQEPMEEYILLLGDNNVQDTPGFGSWLLSVAGKTWEKVSMELTLRSYSAACFVSEYQAVVITGGKDRACARTTQILYPMMKKSDTRSPMLKARDGHASLYYGGIVYVFGGFNEETGSLEYCEGYDLVNDSWEEKCSMTSKRSMFGISQFRTDAYAFGGHHKGYLNTVEKYTFQTDLWQRIPVLLPYNAAGIGVCQYQNKLLFLGGCYSSNTYNSVHRFDPENLEISKLADMREGRAFAKVYQIDAKVLVLGGGKNFSAEQFNGETWTPYLTEGDPKSNLEKFTSVLLA